MKTFDLADLVAVTGGTQGWLHPKEVESETAGVHSAHSWVKDSTNISCTGGFWHGCPSPKKED
jgi:hypothetical protein